MKTKTWTPPGASAAFPAESAFGLAQRFNVTPQGKPAEEFGAVAAAFFSLKLMRGGIPFTVTTLNFDEVAEYNREGLQGHPEFLDTIHIIETLLLQEYRRGMGDTLQTIEQTFGISSNT